MMQIKSKTKFYYAITQTKTIIFRTKMFIFIFKNLQRSTKFQVKNAVSLLISAIIF